MSTLTTRAAVVWVPRMEVEYFAAARLSILRATVAMFSALDRQSRCMRAECWPAPMLVARRQPSVVRLSPVCVCVCVSSADAKERAEKISAREEVAMRLVLHAAAVGLDDVPYLATCRPGHADWQLGRGPWEQKYSHNCMHLALTSAARQITTQLNRRLRMQVSIPLRLHPYLPQSYQNNHFVTILIGLPPRFLSSRH